MTKKGSNKMKIKVRTQNGQVDPIVDENNDAATEMTQQEIDQMYQNGPQYIGTILYTHSSPGCVVLCSRGRCYRICY